MKAIIMAGGEGTRLRPVSSNRPKPMVDIMDRPVLEHVLNFLKRNGVTEACLTLRYLPRMITDFFGDGKAFGMSIESRTESEPLGTAGSVKSCEDYIGGEDFIVMSGDCICDFDLEKVIDFHRKNKAEVTLALYSHTEPLEYGLVVTREDGLIERFVEKPPWDGVLTDLINTGIYVISPAVLKDIPENTPYDFGKDLFPRLLRERRRLYGAEVKGYWCDIGNSAAYLRCCADTLKGITHIALPAPETGNRIWCFSETPEDAVIVPPVYIGKNAVIGSGTEIGPFAVIGESSTVAAGAAVRNSVLNGAFIHENATVYGAVICRDASIGRGSTVCEGAVVGEDCLIGENCIVSSSVKIWPNREVSAGALVRTNISQGMLRGGLRFSSPGVISGEAWVTITPEACIAMGAAAAKAGHVGVGWCGGESARVMAEAFGCGVCSGGGDLLRYDPGFTAAASFAGMNFGLPISVFIRQTGDRLGMTFFGKDGGPLSHDWERKLEAAAVDPPRAASGRTGNTSAAGGVPEAYVAAAVRMAGGAGSASGLCVSVAGCGAENRALRSALTSLGCKIVEKRRGIPVFEAMESGTALRAEDEDGRPLDEEHMGVLTALVEFERGCRKIAVPYGAPAALDAMAEGYGASVLRVGRDGPEAEELYVEQLFMRDGIIAAAIVCSWMRERDETLCTLSSRVPKFWSVVREIPIRCDRGTVMRAMAASCLEMGEELAADLRLDMKTGFVHVSPSRERSALRIRSESGDEETAEELCADFERRAWEIDNA